MIGLFMNGGFPGKCHLESLARLAPKRYQTINYALVLPVFRRTGIRSLFPTEFPFVQL